jgi:hypothetical protein
VPKKKTDGRGRWRRVTLAQWRRVDWSLPNLRIAERLGCSPSLVTIGRRQWGPPLRRKSYAFRAYLAANAKKLHGLPIPEVIRRSGCDISYALARHFMQRAGVRTYRFVTDGKRMDWRLPNKAGAGGTESEVGLAKQGDGHEHGVPARGDRGGEEGGGGGRRKGGDGREAVREEARQTKRDEATRRGRRHDYLVHGAALNQIYALGVRGERPPPQGTVRDARGAPGGPG